MVAKTHEVRTFSYHDTLVATVTTMALTATNKIIYLDSSCVWYSWTVHTVDKSSEKMQGFLYPPCPSCSLACTLSVLSLFRIKTCHMSHMMRKRTQRPFWSFVPCGSRVQIRSFVWLCRNTRVHRSACCVFSLLRFITTLTTCRLWWYCHAAHGGF